MVTTGVRVQMLFFTGVTALVQTKILMQAAKKELINEQTHLK